MAKPKSAKSAKSVLGRRDIDSRVMELLVDAAALKPTVEGLRETLDHVLTQVKMTNGQVQDHRKILTRHDDRLGSLETTRSVDQAVDHERDIARRAVERDRESNTNETRRVKGDLRVAITAAAIGGLLLVIATILGAVIAKAIGA